MSNVEIASSAAEAPTKKRLWVQGAVLGVVSALVIGVYAYMAHEGYVLSSSLNAANSYYNLLVQGFRAGQLNLKTSVPPGWRNSPTPTIQKLIHLIP